MSVFLPEWVILHYNPGSALESFELVTLAADRTLPAGRLAATPTAGAAVAALRLFGGRDAIVALWRYMRERRDEPTTEDDRVLWALECAMFPPGSAVRA